MGARTKSRPQAPSGRRGLVPATLLLIAGVLAIPQGAGAARRAPRQPQAPVVEVERVLGTTRDLGRGRLLRAFTGRKPQALFVRPYGVAFSGRDLLVTDPSAGRVVRVSARGRLASTPEGLLSGPLGIAVCPFGPVVTDSRSGSVLLLEHDLRAGSVLLSALERPTGVVCRGNRLFVAETGRHRIVVAEVGADGSVRVQRTIGRRGDGPGELNFPTALALAEDRLWVGDTLNFRLQAFDLESNSVVATFGRLGDAIGDMPRLKGLAVDEHDNLWVSDAHLDQVFVYAGDGELLMVIGGAGSLPGAFSFPAGLASDGAGRVAVVDSLNRRVQLLVTEGMVRTATRGGAR